MQQHIPRIHVLNITSLFLSLFLSCKIVSSFVSCIIVSPVASSLLLVLAAVFISTLSVIAFNKIIHASVLAKKFKFRNYAEATREKSKLVKSLLNIGVGEGEEFGGSPGGCLE